MSSRLSAPVQAPPLPVVAAAAPLSTPSAIPAAGGALVLGFASTSWVRVEDVSGKVLLSGVVQGGDRETVSGRPPYSLFLGNAPGVTVEYQGRPIDLRPYTKSNDTARLNVP
jgi:cytoskeleton protein RodZ